jgi:hypothetical protein
MINRAFLLMAALMVAGCNTAPVIVPDTTSDSPIIMKLKHQILNGTQITSNWGWILWYLPVVALVVGWGYREFFGRKRDQ